MTKFNFSHDALSAIEETGCDPEEDLKALINGTHTPASLWAHCLDGAGADRVAGWRDYFSELVIAYEEATGVTVDVAAICAEGD